MMMTNTYHLLGFHMHQPLGNLELLLDVNPREARQIILCYQRVLKYAARYDDVARFCVGFSGVLLEQFQDPDIVSRYSDIVDIPKMLEGYLNASNIEIVGTGYYHPVFPLIPPEDWDDQLERSKNKYLEIFGQEPKIFWPPEMGFSMEMIPALVSHGYEYVIVDSVHVMPREPLRREDVVYLVHTAEYRGKKIVVIPRDRDISNAQETGLDPSRFANEINSRTTSAGSPCLVTTWSDGENGMWFRQTEEETGYWGHFFAPYMDMVRSGQIAIRPAFLSEFIAENPPVNKVEVRTGAWNIGEKDGSDFSQWVGSGSQTRALEEIWQLSKTYHGLVQAFSKKADKEVRQKLEHARNYLLTAETSCYLYWGDAWIPKLHDVTEMVHGLLDEIGKMEECQG
jgi:alpha-amylase/alpha-mannosidase (GH57 family)